MQKKPHIKVKRGRIKTEAFEGTLEEFYAAFLHFRMLAEMAGHIKPNASFENVLQDILDDLNKYTGAERSLILIFDRTGQVVFQKGRNLAQDDIIEPSFEVSWSVINKVRATRTPMCIKNALQEDATKASHSVLSFKLLSVLCVPIVYNDQLIGVFYADNRKIQGIFHEDKCQSLYECVQFIASHLYALFHNIELIRDLERLQKQIIDRQNYGEIIGNSPKLTKILSLIDQVADSNVTVLIQGASGTGKELVALALHQNSGRSEQRFVSLNCGALPETLLESELFGHVKGAFTDAVQDKKGWFETADGGTIFFDEISEMSPALQVKLLRVLQSGEFSPVGSTDLKHCTVRVLAATNVKLARLVKKGKFREDLFYRLNAITIDLPSLKERKEDILLLAMHFLKKFGKPDLTLANETQQILLSYDFPGNVRELENAMQRAAVLCRGDAVLPVHLPPNMQNQRPVIKFGAFAAEKRKFVRDFEISYLRTALQRSRGNVAQAARSSGMDAKNFYQKMKKYNIIASAFKPSKG
ncbi:sigma 54-interacting transcriptional regulator [candidate division KSB1 bacterium]|nr:sigma 54-interacting transcriptional regulator [candidate division KSB1 bacterium]RQW03084.1 MAG: GAF domain-containing protein [candidate division KSB1 bacterium]